MSHNKIVDSTGRELHPGLVVRWLLNGIPSSAGMTRVISILGTSPLLMRKAFLDATNRI